MTLNDFYNSDISQENIDLKYNIKDFDFLYNDNDAFCFNCGKEFQLKNKRTIKEMYNETGIDVEAHYSCPCCFKQHHTKTRFTKGVIMAKGEDGWVVFVPKVSWFQKLLKKMFDIFT